MAATAIHVSISAEPLFTVAGLTFTNSMLTSLIVSTLLITFAVAVRANLKQTNRPKGLQNFAEFVIEALYKMIHGVTGSNKKTRHFFPLIASFFMFIMLNNYFGLLPGVGTIGIIEGEKEVYEETEDHSSILVPTAHAATPAVEDQSENGVVVQDIEVNTEGDIESAEVKEGKAEGHGPVFIPLFRAGTADLNMTIALGLISVFMTQVIGVQYQGLKYFSKFINFKSPIDFFVGILETISEFAKIISFAFRLFGNIFAGEVLLVVIAAISPSITKAVTPMPFYGLELFVGFIQALVFAMLTLVFFNMATHGHESH